MRYFALVYHVKPDYITRRGEFRAEHLELAWAAHKKGDLLLGGAFTDPPDVALLVWRCEDRAPVDAFVKADPYVKNGLVERVEIRDWKVVVADQPMPI